MYENMFNNTPVSAFKMIVGNRNRRDARHELIRKRPKSSLLEKKPIKSKSETNITIQYFVDTINIQHFYLQKDEPKTERKHQNQKFESSTNRPFNHLLTIITSITYNNSQT